MTDKTEPKMTSFLRKRKPEKHTRRTWVGWKMKGFEWELQNKNNTDLIKQTKQKLTNRISESSNGDCATIRYNIKGDIIGQFNLLQSGVYILDPSLYSKASMLYKPLGNTFQSTIVSTVTTNCIICACNISIIYLFNI